MGTFFIVWYVLAITTVEDGKLVSALFIESDLESCQHQAARVVTADRNAKWRCHEMTTEGNGGKLWINFPQN